MAQSNGKRDVRRPKSKEKKFELSKKEKTIEHIQAKVVAIQKGEGDTSFKIEELLNNKGIIKVSPNKSVAGFIGGLLVPALFGLLSAYIFPEIFTYSLFEGFLLGGITAALAATGDLIESSFKRCAEVKDSGTISLQQSVFFKIQTVAVIYNSCIT